MWRRTPSHSPFQGTAARVKTIPRWDVDRLHPLSQQAIIREQWLLTSVGLWTGTTLTLINPPGARGSASSALHNPKVNNIKCSLQLLYYCLNKTILAIRQTIVKGACTTYNTQYTVFLAVYESLHNTFWDHFRLKCVLWGYVGQLSINRSLNPGAGSKGVAVLLLLTQMRSTSVAHVKVKLIRPLRCVVVKLIVKSKSRWTMSAS